MIRNRSPVYSSAPPGRRAIVTVMVLVVLMLMSGLIAAFVRRAVADRQQMKQELEYRQTVELSAAGVLRAKLRMAADDGYKGESWQVAEDVIHETKFGVVEISVSDNVATVTAQYPTNREIPFKVTRTVRLSP